MNQTKETILIVDDERYNINFLVSILKSDYRILVAKNGVEALKRASTDSPPNLILLDIIMPDMNGYEVCKRLKAENQTKDIPVIFVTAMNKEYDEAKGLEIGAIDYITKPFSPAVVKARVKNHLNLKRAIEKIEEQRKILEQQNLELTQAAQLKEDVERITRHDLKTPLNAIISFPQLILMDDNLNEEQIEYVQLIEESGLAMLNMINLSLDLFKMEQGIYSFNPEELNILNVINKVTRENYLFMKSRKLLLTVINNDTQAISNYFSVMSEELLCYSMLSNLIKNAIEASPENEQISIMLETRETSEIWIRNKGDVPHDIRDQFFDKYITSGKSHGTGLGTYSAKLIAKTHGGTIDLDTSVQGETTIIIKLPKPSNQ